MNRQERRNRKRTQARRADPHQTLTPPGYKHPDRLTEAELHGRLVGDAVRGVATPMAWMIQAYTRIGQLNGRGAEAAYQSVRAEAHALTGHAMPKV